jgi:hypothetical protein
MRRSLQKTRTNLLGRASFLLLLPLFACTTPDDAQEPASSESSLVDPVADPLGCPGGYCEEDNRGSDTVCRYGFHVDVYAVCGLTTAACCMPNRAK